MTDEKYRYNSDNVWKPEGSRILELMWRIPDRTLQDVDNIPLNKPEDFDLIPKIAGCYWIWTDAPIRHVLHDGDILIPERFNNGEVIYNGVTLKSLKQRIKHHLLNDDENEGRSGVSIDILMRSGERSHNKTAMYEGNEKRQKLPTLVQTSEPAGEKIRITKRLKIKDRATLLELFLSSEEKSFITNTNDDTIYFRNGINILDKKHGNYKYRVYYVVGVEKVYMGYIETEWRKPYGVPRLCSYAEAR